MARAGSVQRAGKMLEQAIALDPSDPEAYLNLAQFVYLPVKQFDQACAVLERGITSTRAVTAAT
jgi:Tfp pilus assembly protein PilF